MPLSVRMEGPLVSVLSLCSFSIITYGLKLNHLLTFLFRLLPKNLLHKSLITHYFIWPWSKFWCNEIFFFFPWPLSCLITSLLKFRCQKQTEYSNICLIKAFYGGKVIQSHCSSDCPEEPWSLHASYSGAQKKCLSSWHALSRDKILHRTVCLHV